MQRVNALEDMANHSKLKGLVFKRKSMDPEKLKGLGFFGLAGASYAYYPYIAAHFGQTFTTTAITLACLAGMNVVAQREPIINTIGFVDEGENAGKIRINIQKTLLSSTTIIADA